MRIFLGTPITSILNQQDEKECQNDLDSVKKIYKSLESVDNFDMFCALKREKWGAEPMDGQTCTELDYKEMKKCDVYITFPLNSHGVSVELGWGSALKKRTVILLNSYHQILSPLHVGLHSLTDVKIIKYESKLKFPEENDWEERILPEIIRYVSGEEV